MYADPLPMHSMGNGLPVRDRASPAATFATGPHPHMDADFPPRKRTRMLCSTPGFGRPGHEQLEQKIALQLARQCRAEDLLRHEKNRLSIWRDNVLARSDEVSTAQAAVDFAYSVKMNALKSYRAACVEYDRCSDRLVETKQRVLLTSVPGLRQNEARGRQIERDRSALVQHFADAYGDDMARELTASGELDRVFEFKVGRDSRVTVRFDESAFDDTTSEMPEPVVDEVSVNCRLDQQDSLASEAPISDDDDDDYDGL